MKWPRIFKKLETLSLTIEKLRNHSFLENLSAHKGTKVAKSVADRAPERQTSNSVDSQLFKKHSFCSRVSTARNGSGCIFLVSMEGEWQVHDISHGLHCFVTAFRRLSFQGTIRQFPSLKIHCHCSLMLTRKSFTQNQSKQSTMLKTTGQQQQRQVKSSKRSQLS